MQKNASNKFHFFLTIYNKMQQINYPITLSSAVSLCATLSNIFHVPMQLKVVKQITPPKKKLQKVKSHFIVKQTFVIPLHVNTDQ